MQEVYKNINTIRVDDSNQGKFVLKGLLALLGPFVAFVGLFAAIFVFVFMLEGLKNEYGLSEDDIGLVFVGMIFGGQFLFFLMSLISFVFSLRLVDKAKKSYAIQGQTYDVAPIGKRLLAYIVDHMIPWFLTILICAVAGAFMWQKQVDKEAYFFLIFAFIFGANILQLMASLGFVIMEGLTGITPGKWLVKIKVVTQEGEPITVGSAFIRGLLFIVDSFFYGLVGYILAIVSPANQRLGDRVAKTVVVIDPTRS